MANISKGQRGFITLKESERKTKRISTYLTLAEDKKFKEYLKNNNLTSAELLREFITNL
jgi:hypothetical protein